MSSSLQIETAASSQDPSREVRRQWALQAFQNLLLKDNGNAVLTELGYNPKLREYVSEAIGRLALTHIPQDKGLEGRANDRSSGPASRVESPIPGVAEFTSTLPANLRWHSKGKIEGDDVEALERIGCLARIYLLNAKTEQGLNGNSKLVQATHSSEKFPLFGLGPEKSWIARQLHKIGQKSLYEASREGENIHVRITDPGNVLREEDWKILPATLGKLSVVGRMVNRTPD